MPPRRHSDDDGRTIADMSILDGPAPDEGAGRPRAAGRDVREELGDKDSQRALIFGTLGAGLSLGLVYIIVFGIAIAIMLALWT